MGLGAESPQIAYSSSLLVLPQFDLYSWNYVWIYNLRDPEILQVSSGQLAEP